MSITTHCRTDAHVHLTGPDALESLRRAGISAVRDAGTKNSAGLALQSASSEIVIRSAGRALSKKGGYGGMFGKGFEAEAEIKEEIRALRNAGAGIIKVMASGIVSLSDPGTITSGGFGAAELVAIVNEANDLGLGVMAHANGEEAVMSAALAGVRSIEHGFFMTERALAELAKAGIWWVPTIGALERAAAGANVSGDARQKIDTIIMQHLAMIRKAHEQGVKLAIGTDAVLPDPRYREYYEAELDYFRQAGIADKEVEGIACGSGRELLGL
ncbi:MAG: amidohydrolase family protein [Nitrospirota bacterium]|nr:amidohydrolase family protein [Nitrospirota bacterium]